MGFLVSCDPGVHSLYAAFWSEGVLRMVNRFKIESPADVPSYASLSHLAIEIPQIYQSKGARFRTNQNDLVQLAVRAGWAEASWGGLGITEYWPRQWKGQTKKEVSERRARVILSVDELARAEACLRGVPKSLHHNCWDAIGIGLHHLGRKYRPSGRE